MQTETPPISIDLKTAAFKALLQGPGTFVRFVAHIPVSYDEMLEWLAEAGANLEHAAKAIQSGACASGKRCASAPLVRDERRVLLGKNHLS